MWKILIICLCFVVIHSNADSTDNISPVSVPPTVTSSSSSFDMDKDMAEIASSCLSKRDHRELSGNIIGPFLAKMFNYYFINYAVDLIAYTEMRAALGFPPPGPWKHYRERNIEELAFATPEEYFEFKEEEHLSLDRSYFLEKNFPPVIKFLDERFPGIRKIFKHRFNNIHRANPIDRKTVDAIWNEYFHHIHPKMTDAIRDLRNDLKEECEYLDE